MQKKRNEADLERTIYKNKIDQEIAEQQDKQLAELAVITQAKNQMTNDYNAWKLKTDAENAMSKREIDNQITAMQNENEIQKSIIQEEATKISRENDKLNV